MLTAAGAPTTTRVNVPVAVLERGGTNPGLEISRAFVDMMSSNSRDVIRDVVESTFTKYQSLEPIVLGETERYSKESIPFVFKVIRPTAAKLATCPDLRVTVDDRQRFGARTVMERAPLVQTTRYMDLQENLHDKILRNWYAKVGEPQWNGVPRDTLDIGLYPEAVKEGHLREIDPPPKTAAEVKADLAAEVVRAKAIADASAAALEVAKAAVAELEDLEALSALEALTVAAEAPVQAGGGDVVNQGSPSPATLLAGLATMSVGNDAGTPQEVEYNEPTYTVEDFEHVGYEDAMEEANDEVNGTW